MADNTIEITVQNTDVLDVSIKEETITTNIEEQQINIEVDKIIEIYGGNNRIVYAFVTAQDISIHRAVAINSEGKLIYADNSDISTLNKLIGVSLKSVVSGAGCDVLILGDLTDQSFTLSGDSVYVGASGNLVTTPPSIGYLQKIGTVINATTMYIEKEMPIKLN